MQLSQSSSTARCSTHSSSRKLQLQVRAQAPLSCSTAGASSNSTGTSSLPPLSFDRPAGGGSRSFDLPRSSDSPLVYFAARSDLLRPSGGANRGAVFASSGGDASTGSIDRPGGRGGRDGGLPKGWDTPATPQDPAQARPGGRGGRDAGLSSSGGSGDNPQDPAQARPGGRGGRDAGLSSSDGGDFTPSINRPGGRGGREGPSGGDGGSSGGSNGGSGGSGDSSGGEGEGWSLGKGVGGAALYAGVIAAAWFGYNAMNPGKQPEAAPVKPCCAGKGKKK